GDTLWKIAKTYLGKGSRYTEIVKLNGLKSNVLKSGQVLQIPEK
ncbi:MAG: LysM peptidoglycan-binding domain-containing protein, partial [Clostridia bacterium]|nr:LysM peptidoglycan-binding domain-containing protein [Clostridia bacterium]